MYEEDNPIINLSKPILISKNSYPKVISDFLNLKIYEACILHYLDESILDSNYFPNKEDRPGIIVNYAKINIF
jgi:hypothetical protein